MTRPSAIAIAALAVPLACGGCALSTQAANIPRAAAPAYRQGGAVSPVSRERPTSPERAAAKALAIKWVAEMWRRSREASESRFSRVAGYTDPSLLARLETARPYPLGGPETEVVIDGVFASAVDWRTYTVIGTTTTSRDRGAARPFVTMVVIGIVDGRLVVVDAR